MYCHNVTLLRNRVHEDGHVDDWSDKENCWYFQYNRPEWCFDCPLFVGEEEARTRLEKSYTTKENTLRSYLIRLDMPMGKSG